jgi:hypothetical protein
VDAEKAWAEFWRADGDDRLPQFAATLERMRTGPLRRAVIHGNRFDTTIDADVGTVTVDNIVENEPPLVLAIEAFARAVETRRRSP